MAREGGRTEIPEPEPDPEDGPTYFVPTYWDYGDYAAPGQEGQRRAFFSRRDELEAVVVLLQRHHGFDPNRARRVVWGRPGLLKRLSQKGQPPNPELIFHALVADETLSRGEEVHWDVVHRSFVALNDPRESRPVAYKGDSSREPRNSEDWQRSVRRTLHRLRRLAAEFAESAK